MDTAAVLEKEMKEKINKYVSNFGELPDYYIPKVNQSNDFAYPYVDIGFGGALYIVIREKGIEFKRTLCTDVNSTLKEIFEMYSYLLASDAQPRTREGYPHDEIQKRQKEFLSRFNPEWKNLDYPF